MRNIILLILIIFLVFTAGYRVEIKASDVEIKEDLVLETKRNERKMKDIEDVKEPKYIELVLEATAYTLRKEECGKSKDHPLYGITASGKYVSEWQTVAMYKSIPFGTKIYIPFFKDKPNKGIFIVEDRGGLIKEGHIDIYMEDLEDALEFGRRELKVYILE